MQFVRQGTCLISLLVGLMGLLVNMPVLAHGNADHARMASTAKKVRQSFGIGGDAKAVGRSITVGMSDAMRFTPELIEVKQGETIKVLADTCSPQGLK